MVTAEQVLAIARTQIGTVQAKDGSNPYGIAYGADRVAWCAEFVWWCFRQAGGSDLIHPKTAYTPTLADWFASRRAFDTVPRVGDLVFYDWPDQVKRIQHVGIVEAVEPNSIVTIEGNTTSGTAGDQSNGGGVWRRRRARNASIVGYGHPAYTSAPAVPPALPAPEKDWFDMATEADLRRIMREEILAAAVPDYFTADAADRMQLSECVAWGTTHAANARDAARGALAKATTIESKIDAVMTRAVSGTSTGGSIDVPALAKALAPLIAEQFAAGFIAAARAA